MPGTSPDRWSRVWRERLPDDPLDVVHAEPAAAVAAVLPCVRFLRRFLP